ncbi:heme ABC transporter ATP-binding protein [Psychromarinibacter sp. C21-152]|uniref:Heme ABC transporter ATP-binding protein n=1 Tax=Psychromarinibacter sediminicola TaxID=3033385 RepID=A0AAE3TAI5_9RHOB|nr:heme ABC transporter ATP-binding protein [Psychromarinibacter sediminicola]MDF0603292.1 heme ABC transporter ATP-binding protein [Psychromarinibacter sediminicola]
MFSAHDIHVSIHGRAILTGVDFAAAPGQVTAIVGPNGSGKTTLLKAMTGEIAYRGRVSLDGRDVAAMPGWQLAARRAVLPQSAQVAFPFTVLEVLRLGLAAGLSADRRDLPSAALARVGLSGFEGRPVQALSGGEQQRVQLARVLLQVWEPVADGAPRWLVLDEPVSSLDIGHQLEVMQIARDYADAGGGVVAVMHDLNLTAMFADRVAMLHDGRVLARGTARDVLRDDVLSRAYGCTLRVDRTPPDPATAFVLPQAAQHA